MYPLLAYPPPRVYALQTDFNSITPEREPTQYSKSECGKEKGEEGGGGKEGDYRIGGATEIQKTSWQNVGEHLS